MPRNLFDLRQRAKLLYRPGSLFGNASGNSEPPSRREAESSFHHLCRDSIDVQVIRKAMLAFRAIGSDMLKLLRPHSQGCVR
jgi:hypothetical protein